jgi:hypothetical protein
MKKGKHLDLAEDIAYAMTIGGRREFLLLVMNEAELEFYVSHLRKALYGRTTREQSFGKGKGCFNIKMRNGSKLRIITYINPHLFDIWMCGCMLDHWWSTTELLPENVRIQLAVCSTGANNG